MSTSTLLRVAVLVLSAFVFEAAVASHLRIAGVAIDLLLVLTIGAGLAGGPDRGAFVGFLAGVLADLVLMTPFGMSALTYALVGYAVGTLRSTSPRSSGWLPVALGALAGGGAVLFFVLLGELLGQSLLTRPDLWLVVLVEAIVCGVLAVPSARVMAWVWGGSPARHGALA